MVKNLRLVNLPLFAGVFLFLSPPLFAEISPYEIKGIHELFDPQYESLSPLYSFGLLKQNILAHLRFEGNYGSKKEPFPCDERFALKNDCPQDHTAAFIQRLFPSPDGANFVANQGSKDDPVSQLTPTAIGKLLNAIREDSESSLGDGQKVKTWVQVLRDSLVLKKTKKWKNLEPFVRTLVGALRESQDPNSPYFPHLVEASLWSYLWMKGDGKNDILTALRQMPAVIREEKRSILEENSPHQKEWLGEHYRLEDYQLQKERYSKPGLTADERKEIAEEVFDNPEKAIFLAYATDTFGNLLPPRVVYGSAKHPSLGKKETYPNCGEASVQDFLNIMFYDLQAKKFNTKFIDPVYRKIHPEFHPPTDQEKESFVIRHQRRSKEEREMQEFPKIPKSDEEKRKMGLYGVYLLYPDPALSSTNQVRSYWSKYLLSNLKEVNYLKPPQPKGQEVCEMNAGSLNALKVLEHLLDDPALKNEKEQSKKWDRVCELFSREGFELSWGFKGGNRSDLKNQSTDIALTFSINSKPSFEWGFWSEHFSLNHLNQVGSNWRDEVEEPMAVAFNTYPLTPLKLSILPWYLKKDSIIQAHLEEQKRHFIFPYQFWKSAPDFESRIQMIGSTLKQRKTQFYPVIKKTLAKFPLDDWHTQMGVLNALLKDPQASQFNKYLEKSKTGVNKEAKKSLFEAIVKGYFEVVAYLLKEDPALVKVTNGASVTPLHRASVKGDIEIVKLLIENKANIEAKDAHGNTPLHWTVYEGFIENAQLLIEKNAMIEAKDEHGKTPLHLAAECGHLKTVKLLIENKADIEAKDRYNNTPLHRAAAKGQLEVVKFLIENKANKDAQEGGGMTALHKALVFRQPKVAQFLIENKANIELKSQFDNTPLHTALLNGQPEVAQLLIENKANIGVKGQYGNTPLHLAAANGYVEIVQLLIEKKAVIDDKNKEGTTPLHQAAKNGYIEIVKLFIESKESKAFIDAKDVNGTTALHLAAGAGHWEIVKLLVENGANIEAKDTYENTLLHFAVKGRNREVVQRLIEKKANINAKSNNGMTPLHWAVWHHYREIVQLLIENKADINARDSDGNTSLHMAVTPGENSAKILQLLIDNNGSIVLKNKKGMTPLDLAKQYNYKETIKIMEDHLASLKPGSATKFDFGPTGSGPDL